MTSDMKLIYLYICRAFWRTCSFMLGAALQRIFKEEAKLQLHSFPGPNSKYNLNPD